MNSRQQSSNQTFSVVYFHTCLLCNINFLIIDFYVGDPTFAVLPQSYTSFQHIFIDKDLLSQHIFTHYLSRYYVICNDAVQNWTLSPQ